MQVQYCLCKDDNIIIQHHCPHMQAYSLSCFLLIFDSIFSLSKKCRILVSIVFTQW